MRPRKFPVLLLLAAGIWIHACSQILGQASDCVIICAVVLCNVIIIIVIIIIIIIVIIVIIITMMVAVIITHDGCCCNCQALDLTHALNESKEYTDAVSLGNK
jgi:hypothetical protein